MVNYKRLCEVAILFATLSLVTAAPAPDCTEKHYDQRQNGTENYRLNIDGVVIAVAPAESLLAAASDLDLTDFLEIEDFGDFQKPKPPADLPTKPGDILKPGDSSSKPDVVKPELPSEPASAASKGKKKEASLRKQEKAQRMFHIGSDRLRYCLSINVKRYEVCWTETTACQRTAAIIAED